MDISDSEDLDVNSSSSEEEDVDVGHEDDAHHQAPKRRKLDPADPLHGAGDGIDHPEDAEFGLIQLEINELLAETSVSSSHLEVYTELAHHLASTLKKFPDGEIDTSPIAALLEAYQFPETKQMKFKSPESISIIGSIATNTALVLHQQPIIDIAVQIPKQCLDEKDQLNHRYHAKRALYLSHIATLLQKKKTMRDLNLLSVEWHLIDGNPRRPALHITCTTTHLSKSKTATFRLLPLVSYEAFPLSKLAPDRNNLRTATAAAAGTFELNASVAAAKNGSANSTNQALGSIPTPAYNSSIIQDMLYTFHAHVINDIASTVPHFREAVLLLKVWSRRHRLHEGADGFSGFLATMFLVHLLQGNKISAGMNAIHLFRSTLIALADKRTLSSPTAMKHEPLSIHHSSSSKNTGTSSTTKTISPPPLKAWKHAGHAVIFTDPSGWINLASSMSKSALLQVKECASKSAALLAASSNPDSFDSVFLGNIPRAALYDMWYKVHYTMDNAPSTTSTSISTTTSTTNSTIDLATQDLLSCRSVDAHAAALAEKALGTRATLVRVFYRHAVFNTENRMFVAVDSNSEIQKELSKEKNKKKKKNDKNKKGDLPSPYPLFLPQFPHVILAVRLDPTASLRAVDIGPPADSGTAATEFRSFWGDKSELRRFQDGKIAEAVVWEATASTRHHIVDNVLEYALQRHLVQYLASISSPSQASADTTTTANNPSLNEHTTVRITKISGLLDGVLQRKHIDADMDSTAVQLCESAFTRFAKRLRTLDALTLKIIGVQPMAAVLRHAAAFPPMPHPLAGAARLSLEGKNGNDEAFPDRAQSIPRCLPAIELLCQLEGSGRWPDGPAAFMKMKAALSVEIAATLCSSFGMQAAASEDYIDILTDGFAFRLRLHTERDVAVQGMLLRETFGVDVPPPPEVDIPLRTWHQGNVSAAAATNPMFEPAVRLAKRWVASQWLSPHICEEAVELLVAIAFANAMNVSAPTPGSIISGFLRFLRLLGDTAWHAQPLCGDVTAAAASTTGIVQTSSSSSSSPLLFAKRDAAIRAHAAQRAAGSAPAMFITGPRDDECVGWTRDRPSKAIVHRAVVLAQRAARHLESALLDNDPHNGGDACVDEDIYHLFEHNEDEYEVLIRLRSDALPDSDLSINRRGKSKKDKKDKKADNVVDSTRHVYIPELTAEEEKRCRAVLKGIPQAVVKNRGATAVQKELLIGFHPVSHYVELLEGRLGHVVVVCADYFGGKTIGLKIKGAFLVGAELQVDTAHLVQPISKDKGDGSLRVCADIEAIVRDAAVLGLGLVESIEYKVIV